MAEYNRAMAIGSDFHSVSVNNGHDTFIDVSEAVGVTYGPSGRGLARAKQVLAIAGTSKRIKP